MPQQGTIKQVNNFIKGIITEATPLNFPENASIDEANFVLNKDGSRQRRLGMDLEEGWVPTDTPYSHNSSVTGFNWQYGETFSIAVIQIGSSLMFYNSVGSALSGNVLGEILLESDGSKEFDFSIVNGDLVVATGDTLPVLVTYDEKNGFKWEYLDLRIRDLYGVDDGLKVDENPNTLTDTHNYNLRNQGWPFEFRLQGDTVGDPVEYFNTQEESHPSNADQFQYGVVPTQEPPEDEKFRSTLVVTADVGTSHAPRGHYIIDPFNRGQSRKDQADFTAGSGTTVTRDYTLSTTCTETDDGGICQNWEWTSGSPPKLNLNSTADSIKNVIISRGYAYTLSFDGTTWWLQLLGDPICSYFDSLVCSGNNIVVTFEEVIEGSSAIQTIPQDKELGNISCVASMGNRIFYSGVDSNVFDGDKYSLKYHGAVFFSKTASNKEDLTRCYQEADPTSRKISDLVDTDGGIIPITEARGIQRIIPLRETLVVMASNGIWSLKGGESGFIATEYTVTKISDIGSVGRETIVNADTGIFYWSESAINYITFDKYGDITTENISEGTIKKLIINVSNTGMKAHFDNIQNKVMWLHTNGSEELVFDLLLKAFYRNEYTPGILRGYIEIPSVVISNSDGDVIAGSDLVYADSEQVVVSEKLRTSTEVGSKYITGLNNELNFSISSNNSFLDWEQYDYLSYIITGYDTSGDIVGKKTMPYMLFYFSRTEDGYEYNVDGNIDLRKQSACRVQTRWDWTGSPNSGKWGIGFNAYRLLRNYIPTGVNDPFDYGEDVIVTKNRILGRGRALSMKLYSETGKDMHILGWANVVAGTVAP